ncbi:killer toxin alpha/beta [Nannizzia gypsea CBS 118893]|uniref:chitinase n=1 Tax=Arthroderma gypseum (strain ATCC MYA-4604 / CBS 118893) TaxID=535722 RepID=E4UN84_ARTGP|nr:killer toxin alpha/beta [Nannizzia gypsea CBS 118893]EFQ99545.1 killer toxin alpha/beta [Nannizzia gypsea CBS 118893]
MLFSSATLVLFLCSTSTTVVAFNSSQPIKPVQPITPLGKPRASDIYASPLVDGCPATCQITGPDPANWTHVHDQADLVDCKLPLLFDFNFHNEPTKFPTIRTCTAEGDVPRRQVTQMSNLSSAGNIKPDNLNGIERLIATSESCGAKVTGTKSSLSTGPAGALKSAKNVAAAAGILAKYASGSASCGTTAIFAKSGNALAALYVGADVEKKSVSRLIDGFNEGIMKGSQAFQVCDDRAKKAQTVGLFAVDTVDDFSAMQKAIGSWSDGKCLDIKGGKLHSDIEFGVLSSAKEAKKGLSARLHDLSTRGDCRAIQVVSGDSCGALASRCGIPGADFTKFNNKPNFCATLKPKQWVCCSAGTLPDKTPQPQPDGTCAVHHISPGDDCWGIADNYGITVDRINEVNKQVWGWAGCSILQVGQVICLSKGNTPMPSPVNGAVCGPQKPGTKPPSGSFTGFDLAKLNPCPLNACCSGWGFCGITSEFCTVSPADTGAPGTSKPGTNSCISNCGVKIVNNQMTPAGFIRLGYFEGFNVKRDCLTMDASELKLFQDLTHVHFAFASLTSDFNIMFDDGVNEQFEKFAKTKYAFKKIISFGGWAESTEPGTFQRYRDAVKPANRDKFANNVAAFLDKHGLGGVDFDWEYPGATDIPGVPPGSESDPTDYLEFLKLMKGKLKGKSLSIALPASYWYLKPFPVAKMAEVVNYFVYMTYDLHGQWDYGNKFASPQCPNGNCLRSHVNQTETYEALAMITKAGVPAHKVVVGISSYGRSFGMTDPSCTGPQCTFTGSFTQSNAEPGVCTLTGGYISNAEIFNIIELADQKEPGYTARVWHDDASDSDIIVYGTEGKATTWAAYMDETTKAKRVSWIRGLNFAGTTDWAIDLQGWFEGPSGDGDGDGDGSKPKALECIPSTWPTTLQGLSDKIDTIPENCRAQAAMMILIPQLEEAVTKYKEVSDGYEDKFGWYAEWTKDNIDETLEEFMKVEGRKYMDCEWFSSAGEGSGPCTEVDILVPGRDHQHQGRRGITFKMRDEKGFYKALNEKYAIEKDWVKFELYIKGDPTCIPNNCPVPPNCPPCPDNTLYYYDFPRRIDDKSKIKIANPKELVDKAVPSTEDLANLMMETYMQMRFNILDAEEADVVSAFSMPVFMLENAVEYIKKIKEIGKKAEEKAAAKKRELILGILSIVFAVIPFVGEAAAALGGAATIARAAFIIGEAGNAALSIVDIVDSPESAPFAVLGFLVGAAGVRAKGPRKAFGDAAAVRKGLNGGDLKKFGDAFVKNDGFVQNIIKKCR